MNYTLEEILQECSIVKELISKKKNRERMDKRNYLIALLYYKYKFTEKRVAEELGMTREAIPSSKLQAYQLMSINDVSFIANVNDYILKYPYDFPDTDKVKETKRKSGITIKLHQNVVKKLRTYAGIKQIRIDVAAVNLITKGLDLWEK
jgi:hypothetical protein